MHYQTAGEKETYEIGREFAAQLKPHDVVIFFGDLGAGKTCFVKGMAKGLGIEEVVTSPTFSIVNEYAGKMPLYHFDLYRVLDGDALYDIGFFDFLEYPGVCVIEWGERAIPFLQEDYYRVDIVRGALENEREISIIKTKVGKKI